MSQEGKRKTPLLEDWSAELPDGYAAASEVIDRLPKQLQAPKRREVVKSRLREVEDEILQTHLTVIRDLGYFRDIDPSLPPEAIREIPSSWVEELGSEGEAAKRMRVAMAGWLPPKDAPMAIGISKSIVLGILKARAKEAQGPRTLNVAFVKFVAPAQQFEEIIEGDDE